MPATVRPATHHDIPAMVDLLMQDARRRHARDPALWAIDGDAAKRVELALAFALTEARQPFRQAWFMAQTDAGPVGLVHSARLPVPPIYAGRWGDPGLLMPEIFVAPTAPVGALDALLEAAEADLRASGARLLLATLVRDDALDAALRARGYRPLTLYMSRSGLAPAPRSSDIRAATDADIAGIVALSADHRAALHRLHDFWEPHADADSRFGAWMTKSLTLPDRDMLVDTPDARLVGYAIAQPASRLHFPPAHDISATGVIDDFFHADFAHPARPTGGGTGARALLLCAEAAFARRGITTAFVVCPAASTSKVALLESARYTTAMTWLIRQ